MVTENCPKCGSTEICKGMIYPFQGGYGIGFWKGSPSIIMGKSGSIKFSSYACEKCGYMEFYIDELDKLKK